MASPRRRAPAPARRARPRASGASKREATRARLLARALALFQRRGVDGTTMRDIARAAGLSLGAAYYHFPSKEALVFAYYAQHLDAFDALAATSGGPRERLGALFHGNLIEIRPQRRMLAAIVGRLVDPGDPLSALSSHQRAVRARSIATIARTLDGADLTSEVTALAAHALWLMMMATILLCVHDDTPDQARTHQLVDEALDLAVPLLPLLATPMGQALCARVTAALGRAGLALS
jgi:AcrR family transcriptional regulator